MNWIGRPATGQQTLGLALVLSGMAAVILTVLGFQHIGGYVPCKLCLGQREPYYAALPVAAIGLIAALAGWRAVLIRGALAITGLLMIYAMVLGIHHAGVEWAWWEGPGDCGAINDGVMTNAGDLLSSLSAVKPPSCNEAAGRFLGLSFAGWNVVAAFCLAGIAFYGSFRRD